MRKVAYVLVALVAVGLTFAIVTVALSVRRTVDPIGDLVSRLVVPATPVVLPDPVTIVLQMNDLARLETAEYIAEKVVRAERDQDLLWGALGETMIFVAHGRVIAGVDLEKMTPGDIQVVDPTTVMVHLPDAEIFVATLDNEKSYVADRNTGVITGLMGRFDPNMETEVRQRAEQEILEAALEVNILETADENAETFMRTFLESLGFETIIFTDAPPPPVPTYVQPTSKGQIIATPAP